MLAAAIVVGVFIPYQPARGQVSMDVQLQDNFRFDPERIEVRPGENVTLRLMNVGFAPHTFTLFAVPNAVVPVDNFPELQSYYENTELIVDVWLDGQNESTRTFTAPMIEANYVFVCMLIGHALNGMVGVLVVGSGSPTPGPVWPLGLIQTILAIALAGTAIFAVVYHLRTTSR